MCAPNTPCLRWRKTVTSRETFPNARGTSKSVRILVVDDYEPWRRFVCSTLLQSPELQVVGEGCDGLEAVQKARELQPDLILLDIGLPMLNGIEAANRIRHVATSAKILFTSQNDDQDVVQAALSTGGQGYLLKENSTDELLSAIEAVMQGNRFVTKQLNRQLRVSFP